MRCEISRFSNSTILSNKLFKNMFVFAEKIQDKIVGKHQGYASTTMYCNLCDCFGFWHICGVA